MVPFLGRWARNAIVVIVSIVIVLVNVGLQYSSMSLLPAAGVQHTTTKTPTIAKHSLGHVNVDEVVVYDKIDNNTSMIVEEDEDDDDKDEVEDDGTELILLRGKYETTHIKSNDQIGAVLEDKKTSSLHIKHVAVDDKLTELSETKNKDNNVLPDCLRARNDTIPQSMYGKLTFPVVNLGFPKIGSTSIHSFFGNAGYESLHLRCEIRHACSECIVDSVDEGLPPLQLCRTADVYSQIDGGANNTLYFPQINLLEEFVHGHPTATFLLTFRSMDGWYQSISRWGTLWRRMTNANLTIGKTSLEAGSQQEFTNFFCEHVRRVREIVPPNRLVEIDIEDPTIGARMSDIFDVDEECWGRTNVNGKLHPEIASSTQPNWRIIGEELIRGKNGKMRGKLGNIPSSHRQTAKEEENHSVLPSYQAPSERIKEQEKKGVVDEEEEEEEEEIANISNQTYVDIINA